jgi:hypothetical protein
MWTDDHTPPVPTTQWKPGQTVEYTRTVFIPIFPYVGDAVGREHVVAEITRLGFPDIDVEPFFAPCTLTKAEIVELANALLPAGRTPANQK